jgi:hypothetical protein
MSHGSYSIIVSAMCPIFHLHVAFINALSPNAFRCLSSTVLNLQTSVDLNSKWIVRSQVAVAAIMQLCFVFMIFIFFIFSPVTAPTQASQHLATRSLFLNNSLVWLPPGRWKLLVQSVQFAPPLDQRC